MRRHLNILFFLTLALVKLNATHAAEEKHVWIKKSSVVDYQTDLPLHGVTVVVIKNNKDTVFTCYSNEYGKHDNIKLDFNQTYKIIYCLPDFITRHILVDTHIPKQPARWISVTLPYLGQGLKIVNSFHS